MKIQGTEFRSQGFKLCWHYLEVMFFFSRKIPEDQHRQMQSVSVPVKADSNVTSGVFIF